MSHLLGRDADIEGDDVQPLRVTARGDGRFDIGGDLRGFELVGVLEESELDRRVFEIGEALQRHRQGEVKKTFR